MLNPDWYTKHKEYENDSHFTISISQLILGLVSGMHQK
jgi:hypothetical protein